MPSFTPWANMSNEAPSAPAPSTKGTKRDFANMSNEKIKTKKKRKQSTHWELPKKMKLDGF